MATTLTEREALLDADESLAQFQRMMEEAAATGALKQEGLARFSATARETAARVSSEVVPRIDAEAAREVLERLIVILTVDPAREEVLDAADRCLNELEAIRHVLRDLLQEQPPEALRQSASEIIALLESWLPTISSKDLARLLGYSARQLQRRRGEAASASSREQLLARLVAILRHAWTDAGVVAWFDRPRPELAGLAPLDLLKDPSHEHDLLIAARAGRVQGGS
jgi:hypothetical protein